MKEKNPSEKGKIERVAQEIRTAATSSPKKKRKQKRQVMACQMCGRQKSCMKCYSRLLCDQCVNIISAVKKRPEIIHKIWEQFGPGGDLPEATAVIAELITEPIPSPEWYSLPVSPFSQLLSKLVAIHEEEQYVPGRSRECRRIGVTPLQGVMINLADKYVQTCHLVRHSNGIDKNEGLADLLLGVASCSLRALMVYQRTHAEVEGQNGKDMHKNQGAADTAGDLQELPAELFLGREEEKKQAG